MEKELILQLPKVLRKNLAFIRQIIGEDSFVLYGGAAVDLMLNPKSLTYDLDIAIQGTYDDKHIHILKNLRSKYCEIIEPYRVYKIHGNVKVIIIYARYHDYMLDICFLDDYSLIGQFDIEAPYCRFPEFDFINRYDGLGAIERRHISAVRDLSVENPYLLASRYFYLCAKYGFDLEAKQHFSITNTINERFERSPLPIGSDQFNSCLSSVLKSMLKAKHRLLFLKQIVESKLLHQIVPELELAIKRVLARADKRQTILNATTKQDIAKICQNELTDEMKIALTEKLANLEKRAWDRDDTATACSVKDAV